ncbi:hypothetical protein TTHERM_001080487 (macronuclear) [Tetrahymena thermophila SB210]|uniref:Uncharacterized protein n=1 Tax=Tetrahymena thermophila (strain SB210) TaxID=312017 RepID=W7XGI7_TETTS|nr:hypothetical protein TTHERM_001080487 [Tetrahymena thermophila SB210]EWS72019.1 hypothetical protein TTHERM_001080487 [Tetrahymena thermophila SB210]|eukprot:XP_012655449.1 hypothetical protein TTHERM_001080487 [Tetrahymena thermophila SB210]
MEKIWIYIYLFHPRNQLVQQLIFKQRASNGLSTIKERKNHIRDKQIILQQHGLLINPSSKKEIINQKNFIWLDEQLIKYVNNKKSLVCFEISSILNFIIILSQSKYHYIQHRPPYFKLTQQIYQIYRQQLNQNKKKNKQTQQKNNCQKLKWVERKIKERNKNKLRPRMKLPSKSNMLMVKKLTRRLTRRRSDSHFLK